MTARKQQQAYQSCVWSDETSLLSSFQNLPAEIKVTECFNTPGEACARSYRPNSPLALVRTQAPALCPSIQTACSTFLAFHQLHAGHEQGLRTTEGTEQGRQAHAALTGCTLPVSQMPTAPPPALA